MGLEPVLECGVHTGLPAGAGGAKSRDYVCRQSNSDAFLGRRFLWAADTVAQLRDTHFVAMELVDAAGWDKRGYIPGETPRILERLNIDPGQFIATAARMLDLFSTAIGTPARSISRRTAWRATSPSCAA